MKEEYDFSGGERGKFSTPDAEHVLPIYLESDLMAYLTERANAKGIELERLVNDLIRRDIDLIEAVK